MVLLCIIIVIITIINIITLFCKVVLSVFAVFFGSFDLVFSNTTFFVVNGFDML